MLCYNQQKKLINNNYFIFCLFILFSSRLFYFGLYLVVNHFIIFFHNINFLTLMCQADCFWYKSIIVNGYDQLNIIPYKSIPIQYYSNVVFFPLFPILIKTFSFFTNDLLIIGFILNNIFIFLALFFFSNYLAIYFNSRDVKFGLILLAFSPANIYFLSLYTEPLFIFLSIVSFLLLSQRKFLSASLIGGLLSASRPSGILFIIPFLIFYLINNKSTFYIYLKLILFSIIISSGIICFMIYLYLHDSDLFAFVHRQYAWGRHWIGSGSLVFNIYHSILLQKYEFLWCCVSLIFSFILYKKNFFLESIYNITLILPNFLSSSFLSSSRFILSSFGFYLSIVIITKNSDLLRSFLFLFILILDFFYFIQWLLHI